MPVLLTLTPDGGVLSHHSNGTLILLASHSSCEDRIGGVCPHQSNSGLILANHVICTFAVLSAELWNC